MEIPESPVIVVGQVNNETPTTLAEKDVRAKSKQSNDLDTSKAMESPSKKSSTEGNKNEVPKSSTTTSSSTKSTKTNGQVSPLKSSRKQPPVESDKSDKIVDKITQEIATNVEPDVTANPKSLVIGKDVSLPEIATRGRLTPQVTKSITTESSNEKNQPETSTAALPTVVIPKTKTTETTKVSTVKTKKVSKVSSAKVTESSKVSTKKKDTSKESSSKTKDTSKVSSAKTRDVISVPSTSTETPTVSAAKFINTSNTIPNGTTDIQQKSTSGTSKKSEPSVPLVNLPVVQPIEKGTTLRMMRRPRGIPRSAQRALNTSNNVQNVLQQMVGGAQRTGVPCGRCDCCQSLLSYVTVLRNFMDHIVSGMAQGAVATEEVPVPQPPPCTLCEIQHVAHVDHTPKRSEDSASVGQTNVSTSSQKSNVGSSAGRTPTGPPPNSVGARSPQQSSYHPGQTQNFPHHGSGGWQHQGQGGTSHYHGGANANFQQPSGGFQSQNQVDDQQDSGHQQSSGNQEGSSQHQFNANFGIIGTAQSPITSNAQSTTSTNTWSTFTDPNAPKTPTQSQDRTTTTQQGGATFGESQSQRPRRVMEKIAWGAGTQQPTAQSTQQSTTQLTQQPNQSGVQPNQAGVQPTAQLPQQGSMMNAEAPLTESPTDIYPTGSPNKHHLEQYDETYPEEYDDEDYEEYEDELNEAYVTLATDNQSALLCMVLGNSLLLSGTSKALVVLVTEDVSPHMRYLLSTVYNNVESVDMMESPRTTNLALLEQPDLGISFTKLLIWGIEHFNKGVFLDPNTLVVQNCDELFERDELSAVPDIGWPDCFNSDVFVYKPSMETFWSLLKCAEDQESFDGGDQGLLNMYFRDWSRNISKKLPFIYNLMANVSYTYRPAFKQFGSQVKIVNFFGSYKPLNVQFHSSTGQMAPDSNVHPTYAQFVYYWLEIFTKRVLPLFSQEVHNLVDSQEYSSAMDVLKFFPSNSRKRRESLPMPPSFRVYADANLDRTRRHSSVILGSREDASEEVGLATHDKAPSKEDVTTEDETAVTPAVPDTLPGSEIGNYQDMSAWEHGRMDYLGTHGSDNIMARLDYFMRNPAQRES